MLLFIMKHAQCSFNYSNLSNNVFFSKMKKNMNGDSIWNRKGICKSPPNGKTEQGMHANIWICNIDLQNCNYELYYGKVYDL